MKEELFGEIENEIWVQNDVVLEVLKETLLS
jgi:hypothetical protein